MRPLVLVDVDGPLNPYAAKPTRRPVGYETFRLHPRGWENTPGSRGGRRGLRVWLNPNHGDLLGALADVSGADLVWCTDWRDQANELIGPTIGLPTLPVVPLITSSPHWKYDAVLDYADDRPLVWFDDEFDVYPTSRAWFTSRRRDAPTLLHRVDPRLGLTFDDVVEARRFLLELSEEERG